MAFSNGTANGSATSKTATTSLDVSVDNAVTAGTQILIAVIGKDNTSTAAGDNSEVTSVTDTRSNTWTKIKEQTNAGSAAAACTVSAWLCNPTTTIQAGDTVTFNFASCTAKAAFLTRYTKGSGATIEVGATNSATADGAATGSSISVTPPDNREWLFGRAEVVEQSTSDNGAAWAGATTNWTSLDGGGPNTTGGGAASNIGIKGEFRILTTGSATASNPGDGVLPSCDQASIIWCLKEVASGAHTLTCATAAYAITGTAAVMAQGYKMPADTTSYTISGTDAALVRGKSLAAAAASYAITGTAVTFGRIYVMAATTASYAISGTAAALVVGRKLVAAAGSYVVSGTAALLRRGYPLAAGSGSYAVTGTATNMPRARVLAAATASYVLTGTAATFAKGRTLIAETAAYAISGTVAVMRQTHILVAAAGSYAIAGTAPALKWARLLAANAGAYVINGTAAVLGAARRLVAGSGSYALSGTDAGLVIQSQKILAAASGTYTIDGTAVTFVTVSEAAGLAELDARDHRWVRVQRRYHQQRRVR